MNLLLQSAILKVRHKNADTTAHLNHAEGCGPGRTCPQIGGLLSTSSIGKSLGGSSTANRPRKQGRLMDAPECAGTIGHGFGNSGKLG